MDFAQNTPLYIFAHNFFAQTEKFDKMHHWISKPILWISPNFFEVGQIYIHYEFADLTHLYIEWDYKDKTDLKFNFSQVLV